MIRAVAYTRLSADERHTGSISFAVQTEHIEALVRKIGAELVEVVRDNGISGVVPFRRRVGGKRVLSLISHGSVNAIVALRQERLFRGTQEALECVDAWRQQGVAVYFAEDNGAPLDATSPSGKLLFTVQAAAATYERDQNCVRIRENKASRRLQGKTYSPARYGYDNIDGYEVENFVEQAVIARMLEMRKQGLSLRKIGKALDDAGHPTKRTNKTSGKWSAQAVKDILDRFAPTPKG